MYMVLCVDTSAFMRVGYVHLIHLNLDVECVFIYKYILLICFCVCLDICTMIYPNSIPCVASPVGEPPTLCNISDKVVYIEAIYYINLIFTSCINHGYIYIYMAMLFGSCWIHSTRALSKSKRPIEPKRIQLCWCLTVCRWVCCQRWTLCGR